MIVQTRREQSASLLGGGRGSRYFAVVKAVDADGKVLAKAKITIGRY